MWKNEASTHGDNTNDSHIGMEVNSKYCECEIEDEEERGNENNQGGRGGQF